MKFHRNTIWLVPLIIIVTYPLWSVPVGNFLSPRGSVDPAPIPLHPDNQNFNMNTVQILQNQKGQKTALVRGRKAHTGVKPNVLVMEFVNADLFDAQGNITKIIANTGEYNTTSKILTLTDDVVINRIHDKQFLYTDLLMYDSEKRTVKCPGKIRLEGKNIEIDGGSLDYDVTSGSYEIGKRVHCIINGFIKP
ncbi:LPS export ABC transporter periplasmic protein LptC [Desulfopila sp. IMCC35006]|uniref:LPS export ABC transporter periplasmic protein LptC n=1 Tax=Desulfopila sp. IMCC35006 TaxID=2569542 RepID=UPI0010ACB339|nr:LPS export ABC transporter periplasmic protein LptC [Desulfopila sp. IMCC35006]TKB26259.1 LPS export ABC transporter periplasmic protein LptC [Desulfopila sp. IMCC35006]